MRFAPRSGRGSSPSVPSTCLATWPSNRAPRSFSSIAAWSLRASWTRSSPTALGGCACSIGSAAGTSGSIASASRWPRRWSISRIATGGSTLRALMVLGPEHACSSRTPRNHRSPQSVRSSSILTLGGAICGGASLADRPPGRISVRFRTVLLGNLQTRPQPKVNPSAYFAIQGPPIFSRRSTRAPWTRCTWVSSTRR